MMMSKVPLSQTAYRELRQLVFATSAQGAAIDVLVFGPYRPSVPGAAVGVNSVYTLHAQYIQYLYIAVKAVGKDFRRLRYRFLSC